MSIMAQQLRTVNDVRAELGMTQAELAAEANLKKGVISKQEQGRSISKTTALRIFYALNRLRKAKELPELQFDEITWNLTRQEEK